MTTASLPTGRQIMVFDHTLLLLLPKDERLTFAKRLTEVGDVLAFAGVGDLKETEPRLADYFKILPALDVSPLVKELESSGNNSLVWYISSNQEFLLNAKKHGATTRKVSSYHELRQLLEEHLKHRQVEMAMSSNKH
jgi:hypothetical protein